MAEQQWLWFDDVSEMTALDLVNVQFKAIPSLENVIVDILHYKRPSDELDKRLAGYGWTVRFTQVERPKEVWVYDEHGIEFENFNDYARYVHYVEREREEEEWEEEYWRRRDDPYWKNDSDYDWVVDD